MQSFKMLLSWKGADFAYAFSAPIKLSCDFVLASIYVLYYKWFMYGESSLYPWNEVNLIIV